MDTLPTSPKDLVERTRDERSLLKLIQLAVPGFRGYRKKEDIRQADALVRDGLARGVATARASLERHREVIAGSGGLAGLASIARVLSLVRSLELELRHAEQGYSEARSALQVGEAELLTLYDHDARLLDAVEAIAHAAASLPAGAETDARLATLEASVTALRRDVGDRRRMILKLM